jgi:hypothetical protein
MPCGMNDTSEGLAVVAGVLWVYLWLQEARAAVVIGMLCVVGLSFVGVSLLMVPSGVGEKIHRIFSCPRWTRRDILLLARQVVI